MVDGPTRREELVTPLQPKDFFRGVWTGNGELVPHPLLRWFVPKERIHHRTEAIWLSDKIWTVKDRLSFLQAKLWDAKCSRNLSRRTASM